MSVAAQKSKSAATAEQKVAYDEVPYESFAYPQTHPSHLSTLATLFGIQAPDIATAKVLELGCAGGGNLFPLALQYPKATFHGIDLSGEQIAEANEGKKALNLANAEFVAQNILDFAPKGKEKYDYIICHGIFSWVPEAVRDKILDICDKHLSDNGVAVISYNALPGWNAVRSLREMMIYHTSRFKTPDEKVAQARKMLEFLLESVPEGAVGYRDVIANEMKLLKNINNSYLYHDHLEGINAQYYLHEFVKMANDHNLEYVGDNNIASMFVGNMPAKALDTLKVLNDVVRQEQYMDFITNRRFRSSILCKKGLKLNRNLKNEQILDYYLTGSPNLRPSGTDPKEKIVFKLNNGNFTTHDIVGGTLFLELCASGNRPVKATDLIARTLKKLPKADEAAVRKVLVEQGLQLVLRGYLQLHGASPACADKVGQKPESFALARYEAGMPKCRTVTNVFSQTLPCDALGAVVLTLLDGTRTVAQVVDILVDRAQKGLLKVEKEGARLTDATALKTNFAKVVDDLLPRLLNSGLLVA